MTGPTESSGATVPGATPAAGDVPPLALLDESAKTVGLSTVIMIVSTILLFAFNLVGRIAAARALSVAVWGEFNLGVSFTSLLSVVVLLGLNQAVARMIAYEQDPAERHAIVRWALVVGGIVSTAASVATFLLAPWISLIFHNPGLTGVFQLLAIAVGFGAITPILAAVFQGFHRVAPNAIFNQIVNPALFLVFVLIFLHAGLGLTGALLAYVIADAAAFLGLVAYYFRRIRSVLPGEPTPGRFPKPQLWRFSVALWGIASLAFITAFADTLILGAYWPATQVGYYSTAMSMARVVLLGGSALTYAFLPLASRLAREKAYPELRRTYATAARWILILSFPLLLLFTILPEASIRALFGAKYVPAAFPLQFLVITAFLSTFMGPANATLAGLGRARNQAATAAVAAVTNVALSFGLIPMYGVLGAAIAWGVARALYPALGLSVLVREYRIHPFRPILLRPLALALGLGVPLFVAVRLLVRSSWVVFPMFLVGAGLFVGALVVTDSLSRGDLVLVGTFESVLRRRMPRVRRFIERHLSADEDRRDASPLA